MILMLFKQQKQTDIVPFHEFHVLGHLFVFSGRMEREKRWRPKTERMKLNRTCQYKQKGFQRK